MKKLLTGLLMAAAVCAGLFSIVAGRGFGAITDSLLAAINFGIQPREQGGAPREDRPQGIPALNLSDPTANDSLVSIKGLVTTRGDDEPGMIGIRWNASVALHPIVEPPVSLEVIPVFVSDSGAVIHRATALRFDLDGRVTRIDGLTQVPRSLSEQMSTMMFQAGRVVRK